LTILFLHLRDWAFPHNDKNVISFPIDLTTDDDTTSADNVSVTELLREEVEQEVEQQTEWEIDDTNDELSQDSSPSISTSSSKAQNKSATAITRRSRPSETRPSDDEQVFVISKMLTQNAHGLRRRTYGIEGNIRPNSPFDYTRYEHLITTMKLKEIDVYFLQETWLEGDMFDETINGYHVFCHNGGIGHHNFRGVAIVYLLDTMMAGKPPKLDYRLQPMLWENLQAGSLV
jgi:hypothetical protein